MPQKRRHSWRETFKGARWGGAVGGPYYPRVKQAQCRCCGVIRRNVVYMAYGDARTAYDQFFWDLRRPLGRKAPECAGVKPPWLL